MDFEIVASTLICSTAPTEREICVNQVVCLQTAPCRGTYTQDFSAYNAEKISRQHLFQTRDSMLTLRDEKQGMARL